jgi:hypothetical protein
MKYTAPDGNIIESLPYPNEVTYQCNCENISDGIYESLETTSSLDSTGIKQIKIIRLVNNNTMNITITESNSSQLQEYINNINS